MWKEILVQSSVSILGLLFLVDCRNTLRGKGIVVRFLIELEIPSKWKERIRKIVKKIRKILGKLDKNREKIYGAILIGVIVLVLVTANGRNILIKETVNLQSNQYYVWWYENKYENNWIEMEMDLPEGGTVVYFYTTNEDFVNWIEGGYVLLDEVQEFRVTQGGFNETFRLEEKRMYYFVYYAPTQEKEVEIKLVIWNSGVGRLFWTIYTMFGGFVIGMVYEVIRYVYILNKERDELEEEVEKLEREKKIGILDPIYYSTEEVEQMSKIVREKIQIRTRQIPQNPTSRQNTRKLRLSR